MRIRFEFNTKMKKPKLTYFRYHLMWRDHYKAFGFIWWRVGFGTVLYDQYSDH